VKIKLLPRDDRLNSARSLLCGIFLFTVFLAALPTSPAVAQDSSLRDSTPEALPGVPTGFFTEVMDVRVINIDVFVTDRSGRTVAGLARDDFELVVDGEVMPISNFYAEFGGRVSAASRVTGRPSDSSFRPVEEVEADPAWRAHVVVLVDHARLRANNRERAFEALLQAVADLGEEALVSVVGVEQTLVFYSDFLYDRQAIGRIFDDISRVSARSDINEVERREIFGELTRGQSGGFLGRTSTANSEAVMARIRSYAAQEYHRSLTSLRQIERVVTTLAGVPGRKAVLYLGEGIPTRPGEGLFVEWRNRFGGGNPGAEIGIRRIDFNTDYIRAVGRYDLADTINKLAASANHAGVTLYSVDAEEHHGAELRSALTEQGVTSETQSVIEENFRAPLEHATKATGGRLLRSSGLLTDQLGDLIRDFDTFYSLGFMAPADWEAGSDYDLEVKVKGKGLVARHREEIRLPKPDEREASATVAALMYQTANNPLGIRAIPSTEVRRQDGTTALPVILEIPVRNLGFVPQGDSQAGSLSIYVSVKDKDGDAGRVQRIPFHLAIPNEKMKEAIADSAHYPLPLVLRPGDQQAAIGIRDNVNGLFSAIRIEVEQYSRF
jgi:VWFA-related protein